MITNLGNKVEYPQREKSEGFMFPWSTSLYIDHDEDEEEPTPSKLHGKYTWRIDKFSQIHKRELRSYAFEVGGHKWYILMYPRGCDVSDHLSLFLCVANHDELLPGWSHFAQFTIAVVNKDPRKSKYSDTLHRFWKKEHDWGWKKFMELSKVLDGFIDADTLIVKAQVQVIRVRTDRLFRCLDITYRRETFREYLTRVEQIFRSFVEERSAKLGKLVDDKARWSSFCAFWLGMGKKSQQRMSRETTGSILKAVVKHFFLEKEVTSTIVMDSLYSGLKALKGQNMISGDCELPRPIVGVKNDAFVLVDDALRLLERAASEPLLPKHAMFITAGVEFNEDRIECEKWVLTELGCRTIEIFVLDHIFSKIELAYKEAIALKKQEQLICEEEAAGGGVDKENKPKKNKRKQKKKNRKGKEEKTSCCTIQDKIIELDTEAERKEPEIVHGKAQAVADASDYEICRSIMRTMCTLEKRGDFFFLTLKGDSNKDREHRLNPLLIASIRAALAEARSQATAGSALITQAEGGFFSNGFDMRHAKAVGEAVGSADAARAQLVRMVDLFRGVVADLLSLPMPTIAAVTGHAAEAGLVLALSHDYVVMTSSRGVMYMSELDVGLSLPDYFSALLVGKVGSSAARREIALSAAKIGAEAAVRMGIVDEAYDSAEEVAEAVVRKAEELGKRRWSGEAYAGIRKGLYPQVCGLLGLEDEMSCHNI